MRAQQKPLDGRSERNTDVTHYVQFSHHRSQPCVSGPEETQQPIKRLTGSDSNSISHSPAESVPTNNSFGAVEIVGQSPQTQAMLEFIYKAAANDFPVLLEGESGTGKELMAQAIHSASDRASGPFIAVNCGAMNPNLIESELFGHEKGAFTGAVSRKLGRFERANRGTLFLDEIGELPLQDQVKLLRSLQERRIERVGGTEEIEVDVRIIAATNRVLLDEVKDGNFRQDLYYRLAVLTLVVSPLRDRVEDILPLARRFLTLHCGRMKMRIPNLTLEAETALLQYHWPGNIRELENVIERTLALNGAKEIKPESMFFNTGQIRPKVRPSVSVDGSQAPEQAEAVLPPGVRLNDLSSFEKRVVIERALQRSCGNRERAVTLLGLSSRHQLYRLMIRLGLKQQDRGPNEGQPG